MLCWKVSTLHSALHLQTENRLDIQQYNLNQYKKATKYILKQPPESWINHSGFHLSDNSEN